MKSILALSFAVLMFAAVSEKASATAGAGCAAALLRRFRKLTKRLNCLVKRVSGWQDLNCDPTGGRS
jgi:hypothetical protein